MSKQSLSSGSGWLAGIQQVKDDSARCNLVQIVIIYHIKSMIKPSGTKTRMIIEHDTT